MTKLNGWQRLWVVGAALWLILVALTGFFLWPTSVGVPHAEVYRQMQPESVKKFADWEGWTEADGSEDVTDEITTGRMRVTSEIGPHNVTFRADVSTTDMKRVGDEYYASLRQILAVNRATFSVKLIAAWAVPLAALYALGCAIAWIRRGFSHDG
jgi:hypothetical protein